MEKFPWLVFLEIMQYGDLKKCLVSCFTKNIKVQPAEQVNFSLQIAQGMAYLASQGSVIFLAGKASVLLFDIL